MARTVRGGSLETRAARLRLKPRGKPYWAGSARQGLHLGYRRLVQKNGSWIARSYLGAGGKYHTKSFGQADDHSDADGDETLTYFQAMERLSHEAPPVRHSAQYTVKNCIVDYVLWLSQHRKSSTDAKSRLATYVVDHFGDRPLARLGPGDFDRWVEWALAHRPRGRFKHGRQIRKPKEQRAEVPATERARRRKNSLNRVINYFVAALNRAFQQGRVPSRDAWARLRRFRGVDSARIARLTAAEARRLINACDPEFRSVVEAALLTGCRYGEICRLRPRDYDSGSKTLLIAESKAGRPRRVPVTNEGHGFFETLTAGKAADDILLTKRDGTAWGKSEQSRRMISACKAAQIVPAINFNALRHTTATLLVEAGVPIAFVAETLGHSDTRMVSKHYSHLAKSVVHDSIRANLPNFGVRVDDKIRKLRP